MGAKQAEARKLPALLLGADNDPANWEAKAVLEKYRVADAAIGEANVDYVALGYMNTHAMLYWLPRFFDYLRADAPEESFHFEGMITKLSNDTLVHDLRANASEDELAAVRDYLAWFGDHPLMKDAPELREAAYRHAVALWR
jgi:hypothetical protein